MENKNYHYTTFRFTCKKCGELVTIEYDSSIDKRPLCAKCKEGEK